MFRPLHTHALLPLLLIISLLSACGFHLRGQLDIDSELSELAVNGSDIRFVRDLRNAMRQSGITIYDNAVYRLVVKDVVQEQSNRTQVSAGVFESVLTLTVTYQLETSNGLPLFTPITQSNERFFTQNQNQANASSNEERVLFDELRQELIMSTVRRIAAFSGDALREEATRAREVHRKEMEARRALEAQE